MSARIDPDGTPEPLDAAPQALTWTGRVWRVLADTVAICVRYRVTGLAAEAAFFGMLSLPPLLFGLVGTIGFIVGTLDIRTISGFREQLLDLSSRALTPDVVNTVIEPTLDDVLSRGSAAVISIGFLLALWAGSRALNVFVDTITIMYGMAGKRGLVRTRALSIVLYLVFLIAGVVVLALILAVSMFPQISVVTPLYLILRELHLLNTYPGLVLPYVTFSVPLAVWLLTAFIRQLPRDLEDAAMIDGASRLRAARDVVLPLAAPGIASTAILTFLYCWNEFLFALSFTLGPER